MDARFICSSNSTSDDMVQGKNPVSIIAILSFFLFFSFSIPLLNHCSVRLILMLPLETIRWLWTWPVWGRVRYGSMDSTLEDIGLQGLMEIATNAVMLGRIDRQNVRLAAANQLNAGTAKFTNSILSLQSLVDHCLTR